MSQHFKKVWMAQNWILACRDQPVLLLHSSRSSSHWTQMTLEGRLKLNAPQMESSKNWMHCLASALCSFLHRERKQEVKPPLPTRDTGKQVIFSLYFHWIWDFMLFMSPWADTALAGLPVAWCPWGGSLGCAQSIPHCNEATTVPLGTNQHCLRMAPWQGQFLPILYAVFFYRSLVVFSRNTEK